MNQGKNNTTANCASNKNLECFLELEDMFYELERVEGGLADPLGRGVNALRTWGVLQKSGTDA